MRVEIEVLRSTVHICRQREIRMLENVCPIIFRAEAGDMTLA
jgi:hypothetical protein